MKRKVKVICYNEEMFFDTRKKAIAYFKEGMSYCDPYSSEYDRYAMIVQQLESGAMEATDEI
jgi:hypothetical protein